MEADGRPFFCLADTCWELFHRLDREEAAWLFARRREQGFRAIQAAALAELDGLAVPNRYGRLPLLQTNGLWDPARPDEGDGYNYWRHVDALMDLAGKAGLFVMLLPTWGDKFNKAGGIGPEIFNPENAYIYGKWLGTRYRHTWNIIWMLGGDRPLVTAEHIAIIDRMAAGLRDGDGGAHLITFHPPGDSCSTDYLADRPYIDIHSAQSSHADAAYRSFELMQTMHAASDKPFMDSESRYEDMPAFFGQGGGYRWDAADVRQNFYWNLMEGVCGQSYGHHAVWQFNRVRTNDEPLTWKDALDCEAAGQARHMETLRLSRPFFEFRPAPELVENTDALMSHIAAGRGDAYAFIYSPLGQPFCAQLQTIGGRVLRASWFNPRTGEERVFAAIPPQKTLFVPPSSGKGQDWILIVDRVHGK